MTRLLWERGVIRLVAYILENELEEIRLERGCGL